MRHVVQSPQLLWRKQPSAPARLSSSRRCEVLLWRLVRAGNRCSTLHGLIRLRPGVRGSCGTTIHGPIRLRPRLTKCCTNVIHGPVRLRPRLRKCCTPIVHGPVRLCSTQGTVRPLQPFSSIALRLAWLHCWLLQRLRLGNMGMPHFPPKSGSGSSQSHSSVSQPAPHVGCPLKNGLLGDGTRQRGSSTSLLRHSTAGPRRSRGRRQRLRLWSGWARPIPATCGRGSLLPPEARRCVFHFLLLRSRNLGNHLARGVVRRRA